MARACLTLYISLVVLLSHGSLVVGADEPLREQAEQILEQTGFVGGLIVDVGCGTGELAAAFATDRECLVHGLATDEANVAQARAYLQSQGLYGRVSVSHWDGGRLPYIDNLVNLVVVRDLGDLSMREVMRVLAPRGTACVHRDGQWATVGKRWPGDIDEWTHFLHGPDGNPVAQDRRVAPPTRCQWIGDPVWLRSHESDSSIRGLVSAGGRIFHIVDEAPASLRGPDGPPDKWFLAARDAFNGLDLWKVPITDWGWRSWKPSWFTPRPGDIPINIAKRLVAHGDSVFVTLGYHAPLSRLDACSGKILRTYPETDNAAEILYLDGSLILSILGDKGSTVTRIDVDTGRRLWTSANRYRGTITDYYRFTAMHGSVSPAKVDPTLDIATDGEVVALLDVNEVVALDYGTGAEKWRTRFPLVQADYKAGNIKAGQTVWTGTVIVKDGVVVHASPNNLAGFDAATGKILWTRPKKYLQHLWFEWKDVFVIDGLVWTWSAELKREKLDGGGASAWPATVNAYDLHTGELTRQVDLGKVFKTYHHHRCYRNKATVNYILASRRGTEFIDLTGGNHSVNNWVRGTCHLGMMPANGLQYAPPHPCVCYLDEKINGFNALAGGMPTPSDRDSDGPAHPLIKGPAFGIQGAEATDEDWPAFRGDSVLSGSAATEVPVEPTLLWRTSLGTRPAAPVAVGNRLYVPLPDGHSLQALDASDGSTLWQFMAEARIDSPPTYYKGTLLLGSSDGWVYCLDATTGRLAWKFRAAPEERLIAAFGRLESAWPIHGSILVMNDTAYFAAGRSSQLDGGLYLFGLDPATGRVRCRRHIDGPHYGVANIEQNFQLPMGTLPDIMQGRDDWIYMRGRVFDAELKEQPLRRGGKDNWIHARAGLLDDAYFKRTPWSFGAGGPWARLLVRDADATYAVRMFDSLQGLNPDVYFTPGREGYLLFANGTTGGRGYWQRRIDIRINAMAVARNVLFAAGYPDAVEPEDPLGAFEGREGGRLVVVDKEDGQTLWQYDLPSPPVFHGIAAAQGKLHITMQNGQVFCFGR